MTWRIVPSLPAASQPLQDNQQGVLSLGIHQVLQLIQPFIAFFEADFGRSPIPSERVGGIPLREPHVLFPRVTMSSC